jgi:CBS domain-containing protein
MVNRMSILVRHAMTEEPKTLGPDMSAADAAALMANFDIGVVPITDEQKLLGLVTDRDIIVRVVAARKNPTQVRLGDIATKSVVTLTPDADLPTARDLMSVYQIRRIPVEKNGALVGILSLGDLALADASKRAVGETLVGVSESESTADLNAGPDRGTPARVRARGQR